MVGQVVQVSTMPLQGVEPAVVMVYQEMGQVHTEVLAVARQAVGAQTQVGMEVMVGPEVGLEGGLRMLSQPLRARSQVVGLGHLVVIQEQQAVLVVQRHTEVGVGAKDLVEQPTRQTMVGVVVELATVLAVAGEFTLVMGAVVGELVDKMDEMMSRLTVLAMAKMEEQAVLPQVPRAWEADMVHLA